MYFNHQKDLGNRNLKAKLEGGERMMTGDIWQWHRHIHDASSGGHTCTCYKFVSELAILCNPFTNPFYTPTPMLSFV